MKEYIQIKDEVGDQKIIRHSFSKTESKLFFCLLKLVRFGDWPVKVKVAEIWLAGIVRFKSWLNKYIQEYGEEYERETNPWRHNNIDQLLNTVSIKRQKIYPTSWQETPLYFGVEV